MQAFSSTLNRWKEDLRIRVEIPPHTASITYAKLKRRRNVSQDFDDLEHLAHFCFRAHGAVKG
jgi:hypothetical protein